MTSQRKMMKNTYKKFVTKFQGCIILQRKDIVNSIQKVAKQWKWQSNGHLTYNININRHISKQQAKRAGFALRRTGNGNLAKNQNRENREMETDTKFGN